MTRKNENQSKTTQNDPLGLKNGEATRKQLVASAQRDAKESKKKKSESLLMKMAKFGASSLTGNIIAQQAATAIVSATSGAAAVKGASKAGAVALAMDYMPGGEYAKIATGQKLGKVDTLALLGQHGGREIARGEENPQQKKKVTPAVNAKNRKGADEIPADQLKRGWAAERHLASKGKDLEPGTRLEAVKTKPDEKDADTSSQKHGDDKLTHKDQKPSINGTAKPGTHLEKQPMTPAMLRELHERQEREREAGIKPY